MPKVSTRDIGVDTLRFLSILAVVLIHTTTRTLESVHFDLNHHQFPLLLNQLSRFAVPLFFLISGFVLELNHGSIGILSYYRRRVSRLLLPYVFWSAIYYLFIYTKHSATFASALVFGSSSYQLYFIPTLVVFYAVFPLLHHFLGQLKNKFVLLVLFGLQLLILHNDYHLRSLQVSYPIAIAILNFFPFILGIVASQYRTQLVSLGKRLNVILIILLPALAYFVFYQGFTGYYQSWNIHYFYSQWRPSVLLYAICLGLFIYSKKLPSLFSTLSNLSFFVFFTHIIVLELLWSFWGRGLFDHTLLVWLAVSVISFALAFVVHRLPYVSKLTG